MRTLILLSTPLLAAAETHSLTLKQAVERALQQNPELLLARYDDVQAQLAVREARDPFLPKLVVGSGLAYSSGFPLSIEGSAPSVVRADASQTLFNRERSYQVAKVQEQARGRGIDLQARREEVIFQVAQTWVDALRLERVLEAARQQAESADRLAMVVAARVAEGRELAVEAKKMEAQRAQSRYRADALGQDLVFQQAQLAVLLGYPAADRVQPLDTGEANWPLPDDEAAAVSQALAANKALKSLESRLQVAGLDLKSAEAARLPKINLIAQYGLFARFNNFDQYFNRFTRNNGQLGVAFQIPLLVGSVAAARAAQSESEAARLRIEISRQRHRVALDTQRSYQEVRLAESFREVARLDLEAAREQVTVFLAQLAEGRAGIQQVESARQVESDKWVAYLEAQSRLEKARLRLLRDTGGLLAALQ